MQALRHFETLRLTERMICGCPEKKNKHMVRTLTKVGHFDTVFWEAIESTLVHLFNIFEGPKAYRCKTFSHKKSMEVLRSP